MSNWTAVMLGCLVCFAAKMAGYLAPAYWLERPRVTRIAGLLTVALLAALCTVQATVTEGALTVDARVPAIAVAALLLWRGAPFVVVVLVAAVVAAALRMLG